MLLELHIEYLIIGFVVFGFYKFYKKIQEQGRQLNMQYKLAACCAVAGIILAKWKDLIEHGDVKPHIDPADNGKFANHDKPRVSRNSSQDNVHEHDMWRRASEP